MRHWAALIGATILLAGCGGSGSQTGAAAQCLRNALANQSLNAGNNCGDSTAASAAGTDSPKVSCTHKASNEYVCHGTPGAPDADYLHIGDHFYDVVFDGKSITYQQMP